MLKLSNLYYVVIVVISMSGYKFSAKFFRTKYSVILINIIIKIIKYHDEIFARFHSFTH